MAEAPQQGSNSQFDFMLKDNQPVSKGGLPIPKLPRPVLAGAGAFVLIIVLILAAQAITSRKPSFVKPVTDSLARGQEILRVTANVQQLGLQDPAVQAEAATVSVALASDQQQLLTYLARQHAAVGSVQLRADADASTDAQMRSAAQTAGLDQTYLTYLNQYLAKYQNDLNVAYKVAGPNGQTILKASYNSVATLLNNAPLKT